MEAPPFQEGITLDRVSFSYDANDGVTLHDISLSIKPYQMVAFVGPSGAGKSTLIDLLAGLRRDYDGHIQVDGHELRDLDITSWRHRLGYVTQDVILFDDTLGNNLTYTRSDASDADIARALQLAQLTDVVAAMPEGLETPLGEGGVRLSGGQRQRLALARALIGRPDILLLDEATSALDSESESLIQSAIENIRNELTVIVIAHRLSTVRPADIIHVMDKGRIVESGGYDELLARQGRFADLHRIQFA